MIRYNGTQMGVQGEEKLLGIGITRLDIDVLLRGEKILFRLEDHCAEPGQVVVFFGETELAITQSLEKYLDRRTNIVLKPRAG